MLNKYSSSYIDELFKSKDNSVHKKARSALEFYYLLNIDITFSSNKWAKRWNVSTSTSSRWLKEFKELYKQSCKL